MGHEGQPPLRGTAPDGPAIGLMAFATYLPERVQDAAYIAEQSGIPGEVVREKLGIRAKRRASYDEACAQARRRAFGRLKRSAATMAVSFVLTVSSGSLIGIWLVRHVFL